MWSQLLWIVATYCIAALPYGFIYARFFCNINIMKEGSGNIGATNVARICGKKWGLLTLLSDVMKGFLPVLIVNFIYNSAVFSTIIAIVVILGHSFSVFLKFKGGKAVASTVGIWIALSPIALLWGLGICLFVVWRSGYVSAGSLSFVLSMPLLLLLFREYGYVPLALILLVFIFIRHKDNIERITKGEEKSWQR
ncbi:MAG: glycerol-3-phosphate 1-O-acyltransferase PlsY [Desulfovibrionaceae bacterium]